MIKKIFFVVLVLFCFSSQAFFQAAQSEVDLMFQNVSQEDFKQAFDQLPEEDKKMLKKDFLMTVDQIQNKEKSNHLVGDIVLAVIADFFIKALIVVGIVGAGVITCGGLIYCYCKKDSREKGEKEGEKKEDEGERKEDSESEAKIEKVCAD